MPSLIMGSSPFTRAVARLPGPNFDRGITIVPKGFPGARKKLESAGFDPVELDVSEARKMDGRLSCMLIRF